MADVLATLASMFQLTPHGDLPYIDFRCRGRPAHCCLVEEEQDGKEWLPNLSTHINRGNTILVGIWNGGCATI